MHDRIRSHEPQGEHDEHRHGHYPYREEGGRRAGRGGPPNPEGEHDDYRRGYHPHRGEGGRRAGRGGPPRRGEGKVRRGEARYLLLDALRNEPKHGYEIIKALEERSSGQYAPSPGTVYPTLQYLEDMGLVRADQEAARRVYHLTETGRTELEAHAQEVNAFWARFTEPDTSAAIRAEIGFLEDELQHLMRTVWGGLRNALNRDDQNTIRRVREAIEHSQNEVRRILTEPDSLRDNQE
ncbi:MAG: helix-turn-helix transcriptional regulator [Brasilonema octagenarum HA4186-MV1]|nr:PadR family transcriptional regulator [Brasilonema octagenarum]MBW4630110.1 helix-turn-helix transcriptional regulator [Brasilonema octagenarum HA4186-MV1]